MNNILYKLFYIIYANIIKNPNTEDEREFPFVSIVIISFLIGLNLSTLSIFLFDIGFEIELGKTVFFLIWGFPFIFFILLFGINKNYKKIYEYYKESGLEKKEKSSGLFVLLVVFSLGLPMIIGFLKMIL